jgi:hypothetical protein
VICLAIGFCPRNRLCGLRIRDARLWVGDHQPQRGSAPLRPTGAHGSQQFFKGCPFHRSDVAIVVKKNLVAAKLTADDPPTAAENLKFLFTLNADAKPEALYRPKRIINVSNWVIATNEMMGRRNASAVGVQGVVLGRRSFCQRSSSVLTLQRRSSPTIFEWSRSLASQTLPLVLSGREKPIGLGSSS